MSHDASTRSSDAKAIVLMIAVIAGAVGLVGLVLDHMSITASQVHPITVAKAASHASPATKTAEVVAKAEEVWAADESARGARSEASH